MREKIPLHTNKVVNQRKLTCCCCMSLHHLQWLLLSKKGTYFFIFSLLDHFSLFWHILHKGGSLPSWFEVQEQYFSFFPLELFCRLDKIWNKFFSTGWDGHFHKNAALELRRLLFNTVTPRILWWFGQLQIKSSFMKLHSYAHLQPTIKYYQFSPLGFQKYVLWLQFAKN